MRITMKAGVVLAFWLAGGQVQAQHYFEARGANTKYRYADWNYTFHNSAIVDLFYVGVPGSNEFNLGGGYGFKPAQFLTIAPMAYAVIAKEAGQRGVKIALLIMFDKDGWRINSFLGHFVPISGDVAHYQVLDTLDASKVIRRRWEVGISNGFFHADGKWNPQVGPLLKLNDRLGSWSVSYRFGPQNELRFTRVLLLKK
ncbi:MAG: hypothetical protein LAP85_27210 [Acidobacteriia bacterium]|nr:hypothetical protein [Terriglobia bacterium]